MISLRDLKIGFKDRVHWRELFTVSASIAPGRLSAVLGVNGSGKSTFLRTILGFTPQLSGVVEVCGKFPITYRQEEPMGFLPEVGSLPRELPVRAFLQRVALAAGLHESAQAVAINKAAELAAIDFPITTIIGELSKGMRQRVGLAAALCPLPRVLLLDEPESGLDPIQRSALRQTLLRLTSEGMTVLVSSHDFDAVSTYAAQILLVRGSRCDVIDDAQVYSPQDLVRMISAGRS